MPAVARLVAWAAAWAAAAVVVASGREPLRAAHWDIFSETGIVEATGQHTATQGKDRTPQPHRIHPALALEVARTRPAVLEAPAGGSQEQVSQTLVITHSFCPFVITSPLQAA